MAVTLSNSINITGGQVGISIHYPAPPSVSWVTPAGSIGSFNNGDNIDIQLQASSTTTINTYTITSGSLPSGVLLNNFTGEITGSASVVSQTVYTFNVQVTDNNNSSASRTFTMTISPVQSEVLWVTPSGSLGGSDIGGVFVSQLEATSS